MFHVALIALLVFLHDFLGDSWVVVFYFSLVLNALQFVFHKAASDHAEDRSYVVPGNQPATLPAPVVQLHPDPPVTSYPPFHPNPSFPGCTGFMQTLNACKSSKVSDAPFRAASVGMHEVTTPQRDVRTRKANPRYCSDEWDN